MKPFPGDVFVSGQLSTAEIKALADQGVKTFINNRPDQESPMQPSSAELESFADSLGVEYRYIPMSAGLSPELIEASVSAFNDLPRPIVAFCASGMRSSALWAFAHVEKMGVDSVMAALKSAGFNLEQIRHPLTEFLKNSQR